MYVVLGICLLLSSTIVRAEEPEDASFAVLDPELDQALQARAKCRAQACAAEEAFEKWAQNGSGGKICGRKDRKLLAKVFCDRGAVYPNPFEIAKRRNEGTPECRYYLTLVAKAQADSALSKREQTQESRYGPDYSIEAEAKANETLALGGSLSALHELDSECVKANSVLSPMASADLEAVVTGADVADADTSKAYCALVQDFCGRFGGQESTIKGKKACVLGNMVVDPSCLKMGAKRISNIKAAIERAGGHGVQCLSGLNGPAGKALKQQFKGEPKTQVCCGDGGCSMKLFPEPAPPDADSDPLGSASFGPKGVVQLREKAFASRDIGVDSTLFHEMLHRAGLCSKWDHGEYGWLDKQPMVECGANACSQLSGAPWQEYDEAAATKLSSELSRRGSFLLTRPGTENQRCTCIKMSTCPSNTPLALVEKTQHDPVFACQEACYSESKIRVTGSLEDSKKTCAEQADADGEFQNRYLVNYTTVKGEKAQCDVSQ